MSDLKLVYSKKENDLSMRLETSNLIESAFQFIAFYVGNGTAIEDVYNSSVLLMDAQIGFSPKFPRNLVV